MMVLYYEIAESLVDRLGGKYFYYVDHGGIPPQRPMKLLQYSNRVWIYETESKNAIWAKNRETGIMTPIDYNELLLVMLAAKQIHNDVAY